MAVIKKKKLNSLSKNLKELLAEKIKKIQHIVILKTNIQELLNKKIKSFSFKMFTIYIVLLLRKKWQSLVRNAIYSKGSKRCLSIFLIGLFDFLASTPISFVAILVLTFGSLFYIIDKQKDSKLTTQISTIFFFLLGHFISIFWWLFLPLTTEIKAFFWLIPFAIIGVPFIITTLFILFFTIGLTIWNIFFKNRRYNYLYLWLIFCACWFCGDYTRSHFIFGGFPWMMFGHFIPYPFAIQSVRFLGIDVYSICVLLIILTPYFWVFKKSIITRKICIFIFSIWSVNCLVGYLISRHDKDDDLKKLNTIIVGSQVNQPATYFADLDIELNYLNERLNLISWAQSKQNTIMLMPESAVPLPVFSGTKLSSKIGFIVPNSNSLMLFGGVFVEDGNIYNTIYALTKSGDVVGRYKKQKLVPFGEYIPFRKLFPKLVRNLTGSQVDFSTSGHNDLFFFYRNLPYIYPIVCYESIFPDYVENNIKKSRKLINSMSEEYRKQHHISSIEDRGEIIVNLTNDAWMKWGFGGYQHFLMTRFLAVQTGLPVVRLSNNGISAFISKHGVVKVYTNFNKKDILFVKNPNLD